MKNNNSAFQTLNPVAAAAFFAVQILLTMFLNHPLILLVSFIGGAAFCAVPDGSRRFFADLAFYLPMMILTAAINPLFSHNGVTPLFFMNGNAVTLEAVLYGCNISLMLGAVVYWCKCLSAVMNSEKLMYLFGRAVPVLSLVLSMALRFIPLFRKKYGEIKAAQISLGYYDRGGVINRLTADLKVFSALIGWMMESGVVTAESMKARGYGLKGRSSFSIFRFTVYDAVFCAIFVPCAVCTVIFAARGAAGFAFYPRVTQLSFRPENLAVYISSALLSFLPFVLEIREVLRWKYSLSKI